MKKRLITGIAIASLIIVSTSLIYINNVFLPKKVKAKLIAALEERLKQNVRIEKLRYNFFKGLRIQNIIVFDKVKDVEHTTFEAKEVSFNILIWPLFKKTIIIPTIYVESPNLYLIYRQDKTLNIQNLLSQKPKQESRFNLFVSKIRIHDARIQFRDESIIPKYERPLVDLNIGVDFTLRKEIRFILMGKIPQTKELPTKLYANGNYNVGRKILQARLKVDSLMINEYKPYIDKLTPLISSGEIINADFNLKLEDKKINLSGSVLTKNLVVNKDKWWLKASVELKPTIGYDLRLKTLDYKASIKLTQGELSGLDYIGTLKNISLDLELLKDQLKILQANFQALDTAFNLSGIVRDLTSPQLIININSDKVRLQDLVSLMPRDLQKDLKIQGIANLNMNITGLLNQPLDIKGRVQIKDTEVNLIYLKGPIKEIKGDISFSLNEIKWENLKLNYQQVDYISSGTLGSFKEPQLNFNLTSNELNLNSSIKVTGRLIKINLLEGNLRENTFDIEGNVDLTQKDNPAFALNFNLRTNPKAIANKLPDKFKETINKLKIDGICNLSGYINAKSKAMRDWEVGLKVVSPLLSVYNLKIEDLFLSLEQANRLLKITSATAKPYAGGLDFTLTANLNVDDPPYNLKMRFNNIDLAKLKQDLEAIKDKDISGLLDGEIISTGTLKDLDKLKASGSLSVKDGRLWELNLFKGLSEFLFLPSFRKVIFKEAYTEFSIEDKTFFTDKAIFKSSDMNLFCEGTIGFDGVLDLTLTTEMNPDLIKESTDPRRFTTFLTSNYLLVKVGGTVSKPRYHLSIVPLEAIKTIKNYFLYKKK